MTNNQIICELQEWLKLVNESSGHLCGMTIEFAYQINKSENTVTPGVNIDSDAFDEPLFLGTGELRALADEAEDKVKKIMGFGK